MMTPRIALILLLFGASAAAQTPLGSEFTYQGRLDQAGQPVNATADFQITPFDALIAGNQVGPMQTVTGVIVADGVFTIALDFGTGPFSGDTCWLNIAVRSPSGSGSYTQLTPRQPLTAAPNALYSRNAGLLDGLNSTAFLQSIPNPLALSGTSATHIIRADNASNTSGASALLGLSTATSGATYGGSFQNSSTSGRAVFGFASASSGVNYGVFGQSGSTSGRGVYGTVDASTGATYGVLGHSGSLSGVGVGGFATSSSGLTSGLYGQSSSSVGRGVFGSATSSSGINTGVWGESASSDGRGIYGYASSATGTNFGGYFETDSTGGRGVSGVANAATGVTYGGRFESASASGRGVYGLASASSGTSYGGSFYVASTSGRGVLGWATALTGFTYGVLGLSDSSSGTAVRGLSQATSGYTYGGAFECDSTDGIGVFGYATSITGFSYGGFFRNASTSGIGLHCEKTAPSGGGSALSATAQSSSAYGVWGENVATTGNAVAVQGVNFSPSGRAVVGYGAATSGTPYGIYGTVSSSSTGYAVFANGDMAATGTKPFRIDHPDDPTNKYLFHYAAESPEVINFYRGTVVLDETGSAIVELPHYFAKINRSPSYQLTAIGSPMPSLHVATEIDEAALFAASGSEPNSASPLCVFRIAGGTPEGKVSWRVEAVRNDRWVQRHGAPVEVEKQLVEIGTYQHPELYGQPRDRGMDPEPASQSGPPRPARFEEQ